MITYYYLKRVQLISIKTFFIWLKGFWSICPENLFQKSVSGEVFILIIECLRKNGSITIVNHTNH